MSDNNQQNKSIGGLYIKESASGVSYFSGFIEVNGERKNIVVFKNKEKKSDKTPDYQILESKDFSKSAQQPQKSASKPAQQKPPSKPASKQATPFDSDDDDIF